MSFTRFTKFEREAFKYYVENHSGEFDAYELAHRFMDGKFSARRIMGIALALELTKHIKRGQEKLAFAIARIDREGLVKVPFIEYGTKDTVKYFLDIANKLGKGEFKAYRLEEIEEEE